MSVTPLGRKELGDSVDVDHMLCLHVLHPKPRLNNQKLLWPKTKLAVGGGSQLKPMVKVIWPSAFAAHRSLEKKKKLEVALGFQNAAES